MTTLEIDRDGAGRAWESPGFLRRQFSPPTSYAQKVFDVLFGVVAPILCFVFDPIVFRSAYFGPALFPDYQAFAYLVSGIEIFVLIIWLLLSGHLPAPRLAGGVLMAGALFSGVIGMALLPFSLLGLSMGIGIFGFIPFLTALVYLRNAKSAFQLATKSSTLALGPGQPHQLITIGITRSAWAATIVGFVLALGPPAGLNFAASMFVSQAMNAVISADERQADLAIDEIQYLQFFARPQVDKLVVAYAQAKEASRKKELKRRYWKLTGTDIEERLRILAD